MLAHLARRRCIAGFLVSCQRSKHRGGQWPFRSERPACLPPTTSLVRSPASTKGYAYPISWFRCDGEGHHIVDADGGQQERQSGKTSEDEGGKAISDEGFADDLIHGVDASYRVIRIHRPNGCGDTRCDGSWVSIGADTNRRVWPGALVKRHIGLCGTGGGMALILDVVKNADCLPLYRCGTRDCNSAGVPRFYLVGLAGPTREGTDGQSTHSPGDAGSTGAIARIQVAPRVRCTP
jgi:hypothetical protein